MTQNRHTYLDHLGGNDTSATLMLAVICGKPSTTSQLYLSWSEVNRMGGYNGQDELDSFKQEELVTDTSRSFTVPASHRQPSPLVSANSVASHFFQVAKAPADQKYE